MAKRQKINIDVIINAIAKDKGMANFAKSMKRWTKVNPEGVDKLVSGIQDASKGADDLGTLGEVLGMVAAKGGGASSAVASMGAAVGAAAAPVAVLGALVGLNVMAIKAVVKVFKKWQGQVNDFRRGLKDLNDGLRTSLNAFKMLAQGVLTVARSMTFFVATPIQNFLKKGAAAAIDLETALVRVAKVTGDLFADPQDLSAFSEQLQRMASVSVSSAEEFAKFAEQLGQMGVRDTSALTELVAIMDVVAASTNMTADSIAEDLGSIANAFGFSLAAESGEMLDRSIKFVDRTAEVINALENAAGTSGAEVVEMLKDVGATFSGLTSYSEELGKALDMNIGQIAGWATVAKELGLSADEVGTAMKNLPSYLHDNADAFDNLTLKTDKFTDKQSFLNGLHTDFYGTVDALVSALALEDDAMGVVATSTDLLGRRSGRLLQNLVKAKEGVIGLSGEFIRYDDIMEEAKIAWEEGGSLMTEYNRMLGTTAVKVKMLKNGFENFSVTVGNDVLPLLNKLVDVATAGTLAFSDLFKEMDAGTKRTIGKVVAFAALYGPVSWFLSQTVFGLSMVAQGLTKMGAFIMPLVKLIGTLITGVLSLNPVLIMVSATLFGFFNNITGGMEVVGNNIRGFFDNLINDTGSWVKAWMDVWAGGIIEGSKAVIQAVSTVARIVASFLEAHSPPEQGPLSSIDMWGAVLMNTWLKGFAKADFGILSDVAGTVEGILGSIHFTPSGEDDDQERKKVVKDLINFREQFSKLLKLNRKGVKITDEYLDNMVRGYGSSADEVKELIKAHLDLERVQRRLAEIEQERADISEDYEDRVQTIRLSGKTAEEMVESIASAGYERDQNLGALSEEEKLLEKREEMFQLQLETQQELMKALQEQSDLWKELVSLQSDAGSGSALEDLFGGLAGEGFGMDGVLDKAKEAELRFIQLRLQSEKFKEMLFTIIETFKAFWSVITGQMTLEEAFNPETIKNNVKKALDPDAAKSIVSDYLAVFTGKDGEVDFTGLLANLPEDLRYAFSKSEVTDAFNSGFAELFPDDVPQEASDALDGLLTELYSDVVEFDDGGGAVELFGSTAEWEGAANGIINAVSGPAESLGNIFTSDLITNIGGFFTAIGEGLKGIGSVDDDEPLIKIGRTIGELADVLLADGGPLIESIGGLATSLANWLIAVMGVESDGDDAVSIVGALLEGFTGIFNMVSSIIDIMVDFQGAFSAFKRFWTNRMPFAGIRNSAQTVYNLVSGIWSLIQKINSTPVKTEKGGGRDQGGGMRTMGGVGLVGEAGPEMFSAPHHGKVTSSSLTSKMLHDLQRSDGVGGGITITINNPTVRDDSDIDALVDTVMYRIAEKT